MQLWCKIMAQRIGVIGLFTQVLALFTMLLVISMPIADVTHSHADTHKEGAGAKDHNHEDDGTRDNEGQCNFCEFFAHFVPREAGDVLSVSFAAVTVSLPLQFGPTVCESPCNGQLQEFTNKGPPTAFLSI